MASRPDDWMVPVELVEDDGSEVPARREPVTPRGRHARKVQWIAGAVVGAVLVGGAVSVVSRMGEGPAITPPDPEAVGSLDHPLTERWHIPTGTVLGTVGDGVVVALERFGDAQVVYLDAATGTERWSLTLRVPGSPDTCSPVVTEEPPAVWCWRHHRGVTDPMTGAQTIQTAAMLQVDLTSGAVVAEYDVRMPTAGFMTHDGHLIRGDRTASRVVLAALDPHGMTEVWTTEIELVPRTYDGLREALVDLESGLIVVRGPTSAVVDPADGRVLAYFEPGPDPLFLGLRGADLVTTERGFAAWYQTDEEGFRSPRGTWYDPGGTRVASFQGALAEPVISDDSEPDMLLLSTGQGLVGFDTRTGSTRWHIPADTVLVRQAGMAIVADGTRLVAIDLATGEQRWATEVRGLRAASGAVTDGRTVLVLAGRQGRWMLEAVDLGDGRTQWYADAPGTPELGTSVAPELEAVGGQSVIRSEHTLTWVG